MMNLMVELQLEVNSNFDSTESNHPQEAVIIFAAVPEILFLDYCSLEFTDVQADPSCTGSWTILR